MYDKVQNNRRNGKQQQNYRNQFQYKKNRLVHQLKIETQLNR